VSQPGDMGGIRVSIVRADWRTLAMTSKPGERADRSGEYEIIGPRGGRTGQERTVTRGEPLPPTPKPKQQYKLVRPARNGAGRGK
jgi:hypothetical protein